MTNEQFFNFCKCAKAGFLSAKMNDVEHHHDALLKEQMKKELRDFAYNLFIKHKDTSVSDILKNVEFKASTNDIAIADIIIKSKKEANLFVVHCSGIKANWLEIQNMAYTYHIAKQCGTDFANIYSVNVCSEYELGEKINYEVLKIKTYTKKVKALESRIATRIKSSKQKIRNNAMPSNKMDYYCIRPSTCQFKKLCEASEFPSKGSILELTDLSFYRKLQLSRKGIVDYHKLPLNTILSDKSKRQMINSDFRKEVIDKKKLKEWIHNVSNGQDPWFLDLETGPSIIPIASGTKPLCVYPFLFSLCYPNNNSLGFFRHLIDKQVNLESAREFTRKFVEVMCLSDKAPIIVNQIKKIEQCLINLAHVAPEFKKDLNNISERLIDIEKVFFDHLYYHPDFKGSYYLKSIIPIICPDVSYESLEVKSGVQAQAEFRKLKSETIHRQKQIRQNLEEYGRMDALALHKIFEFLKEKSNK